MNKSPCVIMQPTYLPWIGYFDLMDQADVFIFLDDAQFSKQSWQQRNRIRMADDLNWLSLPVIQKFGQLIMNTEVNLKLDFPRKHLRSIELNYSRAPFFKDYFEEFSNVVIAASATGNLAKVNIEIIHWIAKQLKIATEILRSSELKTPGERSEHIVSLCQKVGASTYLSPPGASEYLQEDQEVFKKNGIEVLIQQYEHPEWKQVFEPFIPFCSAIDLLFNAGPASREIMISGRRPSIIDF